MKQTAAVKNTLKRAAGSSRRWIWLVEHWHIVASMLLCLLIMAPRLLSARFGLLDDGLTLETIRGLQSGHWSLLLENSVGRFRPLYWVYHLLLYCIGGMRPAVFFAGNLILLALIIMELVLISRRAGASRLQAFLCAVFFLASITLVENAYTLSKPELLQTLLLLVWVSLLMDRSQIAQPHSGTVTRNRIWFLDGAIFLVSFCICTTKETGLALLPLMLFLYGLRKGKLPLRVPGLVAAACGLFIGLRSILVTAGVGSSGYVQSYTLNPLVILSTAFRWSALLLHDYLYLITAVIIWLLLQKNRKITVLQIPLTYALLWMIVWLSVYLPWMYTSVYYLLPFSIGAALFTGILTGWMWENLPRRRWHLLIFALIWAAAPLHAFSNAKTQLIVDEENEKMIAYIAVNTADRQRVLINYPLTHEYIAEIDLHLEVLWGRPDVTIEPFEGLESLKLISDDSPIWIVSNIVVDPPPVSVRMGIYEKESQANLKRLQPTGGAQMKTIWQNSSRFTGLDIDFGNLGGQFLPGGKPMLDILHFQYGWQITQITR